MQGDAAGGFAIAGLDEKLREFYAQEHIPYTKETKKSVLELDLKPGIYELAAEPDGTVRMLVNASSSGNIKPLAVMERFLAFAGEDIAGEDCQVTRLETYADMAKDGEEHRFVPLADVGQCR